MKSFFKKNPYTTVRNITMILGMITAISLISLGMAHDVFADDVVISDQLSCVSVGGVWDSTANTCTFDNSSTGSFINYSETLSCSGIVLKVNGGLLVELTGTLIVKPDCTLDDHGFTVSNGTIINEGKFNNFGGIEITNIFNNTGIFNNNSTFQNYNSGFPTVLINSGTINNYYSIGNGDIINNYGTINNNVGAAITDRDLISNKIGGILNNDGTIYILPYFVDGVDHPLFYGTIDNYGSINNNADAIIDNESILNNECGGTIVNNGKITGNQVNNTSCQTNTVPSSPTNLTATGKMTHIDLIWTAPSDNGGTPILGYIIQRSTDNGTTWSTIVSNTNSTGTAYTDSHLIPVKVYTYRVSAINSVGTSDPSNIVSIKPLSKPHPVSESKTDEIHSK